MKTLLLAAIPCLLAPTSPAGPLPGQPVAGTHPLTALVLTDQDGETRSVAKAALGSKAALVVLYDGIPDSDAPSIHALRNLRAKLEGRDLRIFALVAMGTTGGRAAEESLASWHDESAFPGEAFVLGAAPEIAHRMLPGFHAAKARPCIGLLDNDGHIQGLYGADALVESDPDLLGAINELLAEPPPDHSELHRWLCETHEGAHHSWFDYAAFAGGAYGFRVGEGGLLEVVYQQFGSGVPVVDEWTAPVQIYGKALFIRDEILRVDFEAQVLHDVHTPSRRVSAFGAPAPLLGDTYEYEPADWEMALRVRNEVHQREAIWALSYHRMYASNGRLTEVISMAEGGTPQAREVSLWGLGMVHEKDGIPAIIANLDHGLPGVRAAAVRALSRFFSRDESLRAHVEALDDDTDPRVRAAVASALERKR